MSSEQLVCPSCRSTLNKPPQLHIMGEIKESGGSFTAFGNPDETLRCPACGAGMRIGDIIDGKFDPKADVVGTLIGLGVLAFIGWLLVQCS